MTSTPQDEQMLQHTEGKKLKGRKMERQSCTEDNCSRSFPRQSSYIVVVGVATPPLQSDWKWSMHMFTFFAVNNMVSYQITSPCTSS